VRAVRSALVSALLVVACDRGTDTPSTPKGGPAGEEEESTPDEAEGPAARVFDADAASSITVGAGEIFSIRVESSPGLPVAWSVIGLADDAPVKAGGVENIAAEPGECDGCSGFDHWKFEATGAGRAEFRLEQRRVGVTDGEPMKVVEIAVDVES
jgi:predicted secreted protein